ncbi:GNAT family N-acetyltransferase [Pseudonocardia tropica]|uniref:GNAT family N-acetyltransferase n=1 Tax=Pseudonocardia tropica TaxID=681289 RepID=A0ABV1K2V3_9PSEU
MTGGQDGRHGGSGRTSGASGVGLRPASPQDVETLHRFVVELAEAESFPGEVEAKPVDLADALFGARPIAEAVVATIGGRPVGFALFYPTYSTILGRGSIHLEDLYVEREHRGLGIGEALLGYLARLAADRGCARLEWWVLRTNINAIRFYERLQARGLDEIEVMRLDGDALDWFGRDLTDGV